MPLSLKQLQSAVSNDAAFRRRLRLQPIGGVGDKIFPPTYPGEGRNSGPRHIFEKRRVDGKDVWTVLLDSVQSSNGRCEEALLEGIRAGEYFIPYLSVKFGGTAVSEIGEITSFEAPHRVFDAIFRDSQLDKTPLMRSPLGERLQHATAADASSIFEVSPNALLFGVWNSTGEGGGLGAKFARSFVSEIVGVGVAVGKLEDDGDPEPAGRQPGSRLDPLGILKGVEVFVPGEKGAKAADWDTTNQKGFKKVRPSEINHGNIAPSVRALGATIDYAEHVTAISFASLRRLRFGERGRDEAARVVLAAIGLLAHLSQARLGYALRSRCDLVLDGSAAPFELVHADGSVDAFDLSYADAIRLYDEAVAAARAAGLAYSSSPTELAPQEKLVRIVAESRALALAGKGGEAEADAGA